MKKLIKIVLAALMVLSLAACAKTDEPVADTNKDNAYDVIVIGSGAAGLSAAVEANEAGSSVLVLEKMGFLGGSTLLSGGEMAAPNNWIQEKENIEDSPELFFNDIMNGGGNIANEELVKVLADNALNAAEWLRDDINVTFEDKMLFFGGHSVKRSLVPLNESGVEIITKLQTKCEELGITISKNSKVVELTMSDGKVTGVKTEDGSEYTANKGVVLATGGFASSVEMRNEYNPAYGEGFLSTASVAATGDGIKLATAVGAGLTGMEYIQPYPVCDITSGLLLYVGDIRLDSRAIMVNKDGKRFVEELGTRDAISNAVIAQEGGVSYMFWDEDGMRATNYDVLHEKEFNKLVEDGHLVKADTIEEACEFFGINYENMMETLKTWNENAAKGADNGKEIDEFHYRSKMTAFNMEEGPYYFMVSTPSIHYTMGGVTINTNAEVLDEAGNVIPGLYAAGEVTGGIHGTNRLGSDAIADCVVYGRIAGQSAASAE